MMRKLLQSLTLIVLLLATSARATVNFPSVLDDNTTLFNLVNGDVYIAQMHNNPKDAIVAIETKLGVDNSAITNTIDYLLKNSASVNPGHKHTGTSVTFVDGSAASPGLRFGNPVTDTNTGLFHPTVGAVAVASGGAEVTRVTATGLGIFTTTPFFPLDVVGTVRLQTTSKFCFGGNGAGDNDTCMARTAAHTIVVQGAINTTDQATTDNSVIVYGIAAKTGAFEQFFLLPADANPSFRLASDGVTLGWGAGGASAIDTTLTRSGVNSLTTAGNFTTTGALTVNGTGITTIGGSGATINIGTVGAATTNINTSGSGAITLGNSTGHITIGNSVNFNFNTATGTKFGQATNQKIAFFNSTPIIQPVGTSDLRQLLIDLGFLATGGATPLNLNGGAFTTTGTATIGTSGAAITRMLSGSATLDFASVITGPECSADLTITVTNAATGDRCDLGIPSGVPAKSVFYCSVTAAGTVTVRHCCMTGTCDPASATYKVGVWQ